MYSVDTKGPAIALMLAALCFLGTWPAIMNLVERRGRHLVHTYLDYSITNFLAALLFAFTLGQIGSSTPEQPNFITQLHQDNGPSVAFALAGGMVLFMGNLACQYAWPFVGLCVTEVVSASITVVAGTTMNYFLDNRINRAEVLFPGVGCFLIAVWLGAWLHKSNSADNLAKMQTHSKIGPDGRSDPESLVKTPSGDFAKQRALEDLLPEEPIKVLPGSGAYLEQLEEQRALKAKGASTIFGLAIVVFAGICFSLFSPAFNVATNDQWHLLKPGVPHLVVYTAFFWFSVSAFIGAVSVNVFFMYHPILGLKRTSLKAWFNDGEGRKWAFLAGFLCGLGNGLQFMGGQAAGYAAADAVQALPLVSTFWGILVFKEYYRSSRKTYILLVAMLVMFAAAVGILAGSAGKRQTS
ncbi:hypothetical protein KC19_VG026700 [Ceratodon purpureus]|uniref:Ureide permease n=1 Tax=Ceratodon purpureus TaxID=3225 RepID=A0A8T0HLQ0_CERPU|nr:hypothetical protein KC19_VG026700 [Ceratodon purpureus]